MSSLWGIKPHQNCIKRDENKKMMIKSEAMKVRERYEFPKSTRIIFSFQIYITSRKMEMKSSHTHISDTESHYFTPRFYEKKKVKCKLNFNS